MKLWFAAAVVLGVAIAACSSGSKSPTVASVGAGPTTTASPDGGSSSGGDTPLAQGLAYSQCMRNHGMPNFPDPIPTPSGGYGYHMPRGSNAINPRSPAYVAAQDACKSLAPQWWTGGQQLSPAQEQAWLTWAKCIRANGVPDFADPTFAGGHVAINDGGGAGSAQLQAAERACKSQMPSSGGVGG
ncbi:MAG: hypothetical protein ACYDH6_00175 [Acidimicrobiales bacterium]